ncbi:MAG: transketolase C-terminal domain-containing protein [Bryobacteraceae bacterium]
MRAITYARAIREAHAQLLAADPRVFLIGQGLWSPWYAGGSLEDIDQEFGRDRVLDSPVSENATTGAAIGAAMAGLRPIVFHPRMDFMVLALDPIINQAANWSYLFAGQVNVPIVVRATVNRGGEQGAQHSQALQAFFMHVPGIKVVMPSTAYDAKGLLIGAVNDGNPVMYIDDRWLYDECDGVPEEMYSLPIGKAALRTSGTDVTIVATSYMACQALKAVGTLAALGVNAELIDLRSIKPWDQELVCSSVSKTGHLVIADAAWRTCGVAAEIAATVGSEVFGQLKRPISRVCLPDAPAPSSAALEGGYYIRAGNIVSAVLQLLDMESQSLSRNGASQAKADLR